MTNVLLPLLLLTTPMQADTTRRCGWADAGDAARLPSNVESIVAKLPAAYTESAETVGKLARWYRSCDEGAMRHAIQELQRAAARYRGDAAVSALLGTALVHGPEVQMQEASGVTNRVIYKLSNSERDGARLLNAAAKKPGLAVAALELADVAIASRHEKTVELAKDALMAGTRGADASRYWLMLAELELVEKNYQKAKQHGQRAVELGEPAGQHAAGVAAIMLREKNAADTYLAGLGYQAGMGLYYDDISYLLEPADTVAWKTLPPAERGAWIRKQWEWRASTSSSTVAERLQLHFDRLQFALDNFPRTAFRGMPPLNSVSLDSRVRRMSLEDRGLIYVRHGAPEEIIPIRAPGDTRLAWAYGNIGNGTVFEFSKQDCGDPGHEVKGRCSDWGDYYLAKPQRCETRDSEKPVQVIAAPARRGAPPPPNPLTATPPAMLPPSMQARYLDYGTAIGRYDHAAALYLTTCYQAMVTGSTDNDLRGIAQMGEAVRQGEAALRTESAAPPFTSPLKLLIATYAMRSAGETGTELIGFTALNGGTLQPKKGTSEYAMRLMMSVEDARTLSTSRADTTLSFRTAQPMSAGQVVRASVMTRVMPKDQATIRLSIRNPNDSVQGQIVTTVRPIPDLSGFALSDVVIAETRNGSWRRGSSQLAPIPGHMVDADSEFRLFHEIYGAQDGDNLTFEVTIAPGRADGILPNLRDLIASRSARQLRFPERATVGSNGVMSIERDIGSDLKPGRYIITVAVTNERLGRTASASTELIILGK